MKIKLMPKEIILKKGMANHFKGIEGVGGRLYLTDKRLYFNSSPLNIQVHELSIPLADIESVGIFNILLIIHNGLTVKLKNGITEKFVVYHRSDWKKEIDSLIFQV